MLLTPAFFHTFTLFYLFCRFFLKRVYCCSQPAIDSGKCTELFSLVNEGAGESVDIRLAAATATKVEYTFQVNSTDMYYLTLSRYRICVLRKLISLTLPHSLSSSCGPCFSCDPMANTVVFDGTTEWMSVYG